MANCLIALHSWYKPDAAKLLSTQRYFTIFQTFLLLLVLNLFSISSIAQEEDPKDKQVREQIYQEFETAYSNKIKAELEKDMERMNKMKEDGTAIENQKDNSQKQQVADKFKNEHKQHYQQAMAKAGVNIQSLIAKFKSRFPDYEFSTPDGISLLVEKKTSNAKGANAFVYPLLHEDNSSPLKSGPFMDDYSPYAVYPIVIPFQRKVDCGLFSGGNVSFGSTYPQTVRASSGAGFIGGCSADAPGKYETILPTNVSSIKLNVNAEAKAEGWAFSIAACTAVSSYISITSFIDGNYFDNNPRLYISRDLWAPVLWVCSMNESKPEIKSVDLSWAKGRKFTIYGYVSSFTVSALISGSWGKSTLVLNTLNLTY